MSTIHPSDDMNPSPSEIHENTSETPEEVLRRKLLFKALMGDWVSFAKDCEQKPELRKSALTKSQKTALHIAIAAGKEEIAMKLIPSHEDELRMKSTNGDTLLHLAAAMGMTKVCKSIVGVSPQLIFDPNKEEETPIFLAASHGWKETFSLLYCEARKLRPNGTEDCRYCKRKDGNTMLHCAIAYDKFDLALTVLKSYPSLSTSCNINGDTPLHILATKPTAFRSGKKLGILDGLIYSYYDQSTKCKKFKWLEKIDAKLMKPYNMSLLGDKDVEIMELNRKHKLVKNILAELILNVGSWSTFYFNEECLGEINPDKEKTMLWATPILGISDSTDFQKMAKETDSGHDSPKKVEEGAKETDSGHDSPKKVDKEFGETPFLLAARTGVIEMVKAILGKFPEAIDDRRVCDGKNALLLAVENRQIEVYDFLIKFMNKNKKPQRDISNFQDRKRNNPLHLVAICSHHEPSLMPGGAMKMFWELQWYEHVKGSFPFSFTEAHNTDGKTPSEVFADTHKNLITKIANGDIWVNKTAQSCSVVAILVATVAFASAATFPGGNNDQGLPIFRGNFTFKLFMFLSIFALCSSLTSLVMFLAVIISPYQDARGFNMKLLQKLMLGLIFLLFSIIAVLISFFAGHFLFQTKGKLLLDPLDFLYIYLYLPFIVIVIWQFPYPELVLSVFFSRPRPWYK